MPVTYLPDLCLAVACGSHKLDSRASRLQPVNRILDENVVRRIVPKLEAAGAHGIVEYPLNKFID